VREAVAPRQRALVVGGDLTGTGLRRWWASAQPVRLVAHAPASERRHVVVSSVLTLRGGVTATVTTKNDLYGRSCRTLRGTAFQVLELGGRGMVSLDVQTRPTGFGATLARTISD
jgi:hypothetical protein